jgi:hypothetical protein
LTRCFDVDEGATDDLEGGGFQAAFAGGRGTLAEGALVDASELAARTCADAVGGGGGIVDGSGGATVGGATTGREAEADGIRLFGRTANPAATPIASSAAPASTVVRQPTLRGTPAGTGEANADPSVADDDSDDRGPRSP